MQDETEPVEREAWRRALAREGGEPPRATDERICAEARRVLAPRAGRWWLPASLAASLVLAVMMVQVQYQDSRRPVFETETGAGMGPSAAETKASPEAAAEAQADMETNAPPVLFDTPPASPAEDASREALTAAPPSPEVDQSVSTQMTELPEASDPKLEAELRERPVPGPPAAPAARPESAAAESTGNLGLVQASKQKRVDARTPEEWYAEIEKLRAEGRQEEARAALVKLEEAHPGWLERHHPEDR